MARVIGNGLNLSNTKITNLAGGSAPSDAATYGQLQAFLSGLAWKQPVRAASTTAVTVASPGAALDGVTLAVGDRVLLKNQTAAAENGVYVWNGAATALTRATDANTGSQVTAAAVLVREGGTNADRAYTQTADNVTLGTTPLTWTQFGGMATYTGDGQGVTVNGTTITLVPGIGIVNTAAGVAIDTSVVARKHAQTIGDGTATTVTVTHNLGTRDITYDLWFVANGETFDADVTITDLNHITVTTAAPLGAGTARIVVIG